MTHLHLDLFQVFLAWCVGMTITYGVVESSIFMPVRIALAASGPSGWWCETFVYCPFCVSFWAQALSWMAVLGPHDFLFDGVVGACVGTAVLVLLRLVRGDVFVDRREIEQGAIDDVRELRKARRA